MPTPYQFLMLGAESAFRPTIEDLFLERTQDLGLDQDAFTILRSANFSDYKSNAPSVCVYFGGDPANDETEVQSLVDEGCVVVPVVENIKKYTELVPSCLRPINGFEINNTVKENKPPALVSRVLEGLGLLRKTRKLFISYVRKESSAVALQLKHQMDAAGFNIFLDTHSVGPGADFQNVLWHELADSDVMLLLNTNDFVGRKWTAEELTQATAMSVGIIQLVWPDCDKKNYVNHTAFATPIYLTDENFEASIPADSAKLTSAILKKIEKEVESLRARAHASRQDNLIKEFVRLADNVSIDAFLQSDRVIIVTHSNGNRAAVIPAVGVPDAYSSFEKHKLVKKVFENTVNSVVILYDHRNMLEDYLKFVEWLKPLPVEFLRIMDAEDWLRKFKNSNKP
jgi:hypothetical protein